ncbi:MAG: hypothetical protein CSA22_05535 [Deltaproteobacteria bacterium]|nr:MAG: hypothetical protein CSA22_05535 [Deltaproteobacteria bacterium]
MIRINLLPFRAERTKENIRKQVSVFLLTVILVLICLGAYNWHLSGKIAEHKDQLEVAKAQLKSYEAKVKEVDEIKKKLDILNKRVDAIDTLKSRRSEAVVLLDTMTEMIIKDRMWLTDLSFKDNKVMLNGNSLDEITVADFMTRLERSSIFSEVFLRSIKKRSIKTSQGDIEIKSFSVDCNKR